MSPFEYLQYTNPTSLHTKSYLNVGQLSWPCTNIGAYSLIKNMVSAHRCYYSYIYLVLKLHLTLFEGNWEADAAPGENEMDTPARGCNARGQALFLVFRRRKQDMLVWKCAAADTFTVSPMPEGASLLGGRGIQDQLYSTKTSLLQVDTMEDNYTSVSVAQWTRQKLKLFQLPLLFGLEDQA